MEETRHRVHDTITKWLGIISIACGGAYALWQYSDSVEKEFRKPYWEKQLYYYFEASDSASILASSCDEKNLEIAKETFYKLFYGPLALVEDNSVARVMMNFHQELSKSRTLIPCGTKILKDRSLELSWTLRDSIGSSWNLGLPALERKKNGSND